MTAAAVVQLQLHEPCSLYSFVSLYMRQITFLQFCAPPPLHQILATPRKNYNA